MGPKCQLEPFFVDLTMNYTPQIRGRHVRLGNFGTSARLVVAFSSFYESHKPPPSGDVCGIVLAHRHCHQNGQQRGVILYHHFVDCRPGGRRGNTEWVITRWQHPVASGVAVVMLHWLMHYVLHRRTAILIEMADGKGALFPIVDFVIDNNHSYITCNSQYKLTP